MKKIFVLSLILIVMAGWWWKSSSQPVISNTTDSTQSERSPEEILNDDYQKIARNLKPENTSGDEWKQINTYSLTPEKIVTQKSAAEFFKVAQNNIPDIFSCLKKDFCGMTTRGDDDAYFDDQRTPAHILLNRNLKIMKEALRKDNSLKSRVDWEMLYGLASSEAELIQVEALDILREFDNESIKTEELIKLTETYTGSAKAEALLRLSKGTNATDKILVASEIEEVFAMSDANTVISVLENVGKMGMGKTEISRMFKNLCRFKENSDEAHNWSMIKYEATKINPEFEKLCN